MTDSAAASFFVRIVAGDAATLYERETSLGSLGWFAFAVLQAQQPETLTFADAWTRYPGDPRAGDNGGLFIVAGQRPADPGQYLSGLVRVIARLNAQTSFAYRYLFVGDPTSAVATDCPGIVPFFTTSADPATPGQIASQTTITARNVGIVAAQGAFIYADIPGTGLRLAANGANNIVLLANKYVSKNLPSLTSDVRFPLLADGEGSFNFSMTLRYSSNPRDDDFTLLDVGLKYFTQRGGRILSLRYPLFGAPTDQAPIPMTVRFDPLRPLQHNRCFFVFAGDGKACVPMDSALRDGFVHPVRITPQAGISALVLQTDTVAINTVDPRQHDFYYLVPSGPFTLSAGASQPPASRVMCGVSPLETVLFDPPGSVLTFAPDQNAYAPSLSDEPVDSSTPRLTNRYLTAWATITAADAAPTGPAPTYLSQPQGSAMFASGATPTTYLQHQETPACVLRDSSPGASFPLVPYGAVAFATYPDTLSPADVARLESDVIAVERRARITAYGQPPARGAVHPAFFAADVASRVMTPQGFIVDLANDGTGGWKRMHLAQTSFSPDPAQTPPVVTTLAFDNVDATLRAAFQTSQQCLIVTQPKAPWTLQAAGGSGTTFEDELRPQGWPFNVRVGQGSNPGDFRNVLIFKFCDGSLDARLDDPSTWTAAEDFNADTGSVARWLRSYVDNAKRLAQGPDGAYFQRFVAAVTQPSWRGILALRTDIDPSALPSQLRGLVAGINLSLFNAHHVGVDLSFVDSSGGRLDADGNSSVFATVYYVDPDYAQNLASGANPNLPVAVSTAADFAFRVLTLKTLFSNAEIVAFASKLQITLNKFFGDQTTALTLNGLQAPSTSLVLDGTYQNYDGVGTYSFSSSDDAFFLAASNLWNGVEIVNATFATLRTPASGAVLSRFTFNGFLDFATVTAGGANGPTPFDLLSFGAAKTHAPGNGLPFAQLYVDMTYDTASPSTPSFAFSIDQMTFAPTLQQARPESLYARLPLTLTGIMASASSPDSLGYLRVSPLNVPTDSLTETWYGLAYTLDLGAAGALAAKAGFAARVLVAWAPGSADQTYRIHIGLSLPGTGGGTSRALSLQSVLKLTIQSLLLYIDPTSKTFILRLTNVLLSLLGVSLPPDTATAFIVFGNPDGNRDTVGWYAALNREKKSAALLEEV